MGISTWTWPKSAMILASAALVSSGFAGAAGCWFSKGKEGYVCKTSKDCRKGLYCRTFGRGRKSRRQCRPRGTRSISSKSGYTVYAIYLSYIFWIGLPIVLAILFVRARMQKKAGSGKPGGGSAGGAPPPASPPPDAPPPPDPPPPAAGGGSTGSA
jgi:hypothetical protein